MRSEQFPIRVTPKEINLDEEVKKCAEYFSRVPILQETITRLPGETLSDFIKRIKNEKEKLP